MARLGKRERKELRERKKYEHALRLAQFARIERVNPHPIRTSWIKTANDIVGNGRPDWSYNANTARRINRRSKVREFEVVTLIK